MKDRIRRARSGTLLLETLVASAVTVTMVVAALPLLAGAASRLDGGDDAGRLSTTLEALRAAMGDARLVVEPRAPSGARRGTRLVFVDGSGWVWTVAVAEGRLRAERREPGTGLRRLFDLGWCDGAVFHDRGRTRRLVRVRLRLGEAVLLTSIRLDQPVEPHPLPDDGMMWMGPVPVEVPDDGRWPS